jgi:hypothetical protein
MPRLEEAVKTFIVERLAQYARPTEVVDAVKEEFGVTITRQAVEEYDPEKRCTTQKWVDLHKATRAAFLERKAGLAISHRSWRLQQLEEMARAARKSRNYKLASSLLEQAAKEEGDFYVNSGRARRRGRPVGGRARRADAPAGPRDGRSDARPAADRGPRTVRSLVKSA